MTDRLGHAMRAFPDGRWRYKFDPDMGAGAQELERLWADVRRIRCPTLLVRGAESPQSNQKQQRPASK